ncbi:MAG TPA: TIGR01897 family CRISPR-associated protein [Aquificaceae bacterium]|nr:TIGR01897 family CRISPR-associated protein [Aquificaceae bacterium]
MEFRVNMDTTKILVAIWGNFSAWKDANYRYKNKIYTSSTTLPLLLDTIKPNYTYIILADTLMDKYDNIFTYQEGLARIKNEAGAFIKEKIRSYPTKLKEDNINILILPAVGTFSRSRFVGNPNNFYALVYFELARNILRNLGSKLAFISENNKPCLELYLDITHGLNFMTMMTYRAVKDILQIIAYFCKVRLIVLNSDPLVGSGNIDLNINEIEKINVIPAFNFYKYQQHGAKFINVNTYANLNENRKREIGTELSKNDSIINLKQKMSNIYAFCGAFLHGLPIYIYYFYEEITKEDIKPLINLFYSYIKLNYKETSDTQEINIIQETNFTEEFLSLLQAYILSSLLKNIYSVEKKEELSLEDIEKVKGVFKYSRVISQRLERELSRLKDLKEKEDFDFKDYGLIAIGEGKYQGNSSFDERNFFAHCGFGYNVIQVKKHSNLIFIRPKKGMINQIKDAINRSLPLGG